MSQVMVAGKVACGEGASPVTVKTTVTGNQVAKFSVFDKDYYPKRDGKEEVTKFYRCEVWGKQAELVNDRLKRGSHIAVSGQLEPEIFNEKLYLNIKNAQVVFIDDRPSDTMSSEALPF